MSPALPTLQLAYILTDEFLLWTFDFNLSNITDMDVNIRTSDHINRKANATLPSTKTRRYLHLNCLPSLVTILSAKVPAKLRFSYELLT